MDFTVPGGAGWSVTASPGRPLKWTWDVDDASSPLRLTGLTLIKVQDRTNRIPPTLKFDVRSFGGFNRLRDPAEQPISVSLVFAGPTSPTGQCGTATFPGPPPAPSCRVTQVKKLTCK
jgi:hypothetical protein